MLENGVQVHGYRIDRLIGEGGMGVVYEATQLSLDRKVALKLLTAELSADAGFRERFRHEARIQGAMDHPNIVTVHEAGESDYGLFIAMELIRGATLKDLIVGRELDAGRTLRILSQVADALDSAHEFGLIHRDIKPHNILVRAGRRDHAFLADFGVTKVRGGTNLTKTGHFVGTVDYMAPEQIRGEPATRETDIYALGTVLYECLSGAVPFPKDSDVAVMYAHLADPPPTITSERPEFPPELDAVISTAMAKNPSERYSSAMRMIEAFEGALGADGQAAVSIPGPVDGPQELGLREDGQPDTAASATSPDATRMAPTPAPPTEVSATPPPPSEVLEGPPTKQQPTPPPPTPSPDTEISAAPPVRRAPLAASGATVGSATVAAGAVPAATAATAAGAEPVVPAPAADGARAERKEFPWVWLLAAALIIALAAGGYFVGHGGGKTSSSSGNGGISVQNATVDTPSGWHEISAPKIPNLPLRQAVAISPAASNGMVMGLANLKYPWLLPNGVIGHEVTQAKTSYNQRPHIVKIGPLQASRTSGVSFSSSGKPLYTFIYFPQGKSATTMAVCYSKTGSVSHLLDCEKATSGITISGAKLYDLLPSKTYASGLDSALSALSKTKSVPYQTLKSAKTASAQSKAARQIATAYSVVGKDVKKLKPTPYAQPDNQKIYKAMVIAAGAWRTLGSAAAAKSSSRYSAASKKVASAEARLSSAISELKTLGYSVG
ncbi:MAG TPA: serine/threonine-protein kinase [Beijerinckiaceae bacterium]|nr:serine/threonine-protein kinase [Beijerinckiaceae bacterium]